MTNRKIKVTVTKHSAAPMMFQRVSSYFHSVTMIFTACKIGFVIKSSSRPDENLVRQTWLATLTRGTDVSDTPDGVCHCVDLGSLVKQDLLQD
ncbi:hypothetical protein KCU89_g35, partial [Aureobasidium melanogenum]